MIVEPIMEPPDPAEIAHHKKQNPKIIINIGGVKHEVMWRMLEKRPLTRYHIHMSLNLTIQS